MWANPWGGSWPIQQSTVQNMPHDQVDWASLAKQWIAQREAAQVIQQEEHQQLMENLAAQTPPPAPAEPHPDTAAIYTEAQAVQQDENSMDISDGEAEGVSRANASSKNGYSGQGPLLPTPTAPSQQGVGMEWGGGNWPPSGQGAESWSEDGSQDGFNYNQGPGFGANFAPSGDMYFQGGGPQLVSNLQQSIWSPQGAGAPPPVLNPQGFPPQVPFPPAANLAVVDRHSSRGRHYQGDVYPGGRPDDSGIDSAKRKQLPAWIREGLEKMEREKQRQAEKEKAEQEKLEALQAKEQAEKEAAEELRREQEENSTGEARVPRKSRFDSDDEDEEEASTSTSPVPKDRASSSPEVKKRSPSPQQFKSEEEKQMEMMMKVKQWMTEILLDVTSSMITNVAQLVYAKAKTQALRAPAKVLAKSSALASLSALGLGYGSASSDQETVEEDNSDSESLDEDTNRSARGKAQNKDKIFSDEDSDYHAEPEVPDYLKNPLKETSQSSSFSKVDEAIPGIEGHRQEGHGEGQVRLKKEVESKPLVREIVKTESSESEEHSDSKPSQSTVKLRKEESTGSSSSGSSSSSSSSYGSSSSGSDSSEESDSNSRSKKKKKKATRVDKRGHKGRKDSGSQEWVEKSSERRRRREGVEEGKGRKRESVDNDKRQKRDRGDRDSQDSEKPRKREGRDREKRAREDLDSDRGSDDRKTGKKKHKEKEKTKKRKREESEERRGSRERDKRNREKVRDRQKKRRRSASAEADSGRSWSPPREEGYERRRYVSSSPDDRHSRSRERERRKRSMSRERERRRGRSISRERYNDYGRGSRSQSRDSYYESRRRSRDRGRRSRSHDEREKSSRHSKQSDSKSKSRKRRRSRSGSSGSDQGDRRRRSKESTSSKQRSRRDGRHSDGYERSGKKSRKHKSRSRSRSSTPRRR